MNLKNKRVFVSGGAGVIGTALVERLQKEGAEIFIGDLKPRPSGLSKNIRYRQGDLNFITSFEILDFDPEVVFHLAATFERSTETYEFWEENYHHNVQLSNHLMTLLKDSKSLKKVVFASSYLIYKPDQYYFDKPAEKATRLKETDPIYPRNLCGTAKLLHEMELSFLTHFHGDQYNTVSARIFRVYGKNSKDVVSRWIRSLLNGETLTIYKQEGLFDYIYADEVAEGLFRLATNDVTGIINLGRDNARRVSEVLEVLKRHFPDIKTIHSDLDIPYEGSQANMEYFRSKTGWAPERDIEDTIPEMIEYEKKSSGLKNAYPMEFNVFITSIAQKIPLINAVKNASRKAGNTGIVIGGDMNSECIGQYFVDQFYQMPSLNNLDVESFISYCKSNNIKAIIPTRDGDLKFFTNHKSILNENDISVMISGEAAIDICIDKLKFYQELQSMGYPVIQTAESINEIQSDKIVVKERYGAGSKKIGVGVSKVEAIDVQQNLSDPIFQPYIEGKEFSIDVYVDKTGKSKGAVVRSRDIIVDGESQISTTLKNTELEKLCIAMSEKIGLYGHSVWQVIVDQNGHYYIIECNSRFGGASTLSIESGLDSFFWFLLESSGTDISEYPFIRSTKEKRQIRYKSDMII